MRKDVLCLATVLLLPLAVGCSQNSQVVRGQAPGEMYQTPNGVMACPPGVPCYPGHYGCPPAEATMADFPRLRVGPLFDPNIGYDAAYKMKYREPCNLVYPPPGDQPATVQYPYYTVKGPDCFFLK